MHGEGRFFTHGSLPVSTVICLTVVRRKNGSHRAGCFHRSLQSRQIKGAICLHHQVERRIVDR